jgi:hypothetical protein
MGQPASLRATALLLAAAYLPASPSQEPRAEPPRRDPAARAPIAGISGFDSLSKVRYVSAPETVHDLKVTCAFPERSRWMISATIAGSPVREISYQYGDAVYRIPAGTGASQVCQGEERRATLLRMELRRALMLYPDGFPWKGEGSERVAELVDLGVLLRVRVPADPGAKPDSVECVDREGKPIDAYRSITWKATAGRSWPSAMEMWHQGERIWTETVESVDTAARFVDAFFVPPDLREGSTRQAVGGAIRTLDVPATCVLRTAIAEGTSWDMAVRDLEARRAACLKRLGAGDAALEAVSTFDISEKGEPVASVLRMAAIPETPPEGFAKEPARKGVALAVEALDRIDAQRIAELRRSLPKEAVAGRPYVRFEGSAEGLRRVVLVVPFDPGH